MRRCRSLRFLAFVALLAGCGRSEKLEACDITTADCQQDVFYAVMRLRGDGFDPFGGQPPVRTLSQDAYRAELEARRRDEQPETDQPKFDAWSLALQWLGLLAPDQSSQESAINDAVTHVAAFYSWQSQRVTVIAGDVHDDEANTALLAHELVHAFQQQDASGETTGPATTERDFLYSIRFEGEAVHYETLARYEMKGEAPRTEDVDAYYANWLQWRRDGIRPSPSRYDEVAWLMYPLGGELWTRRWRQAGNAGVRKLVSELPASSLAYMAQSGSAPAADALRCSDASPAPSFERVRADRLGALRLFAFLVGGVASDDDAWQLALAWRDDVLWVYADQLRELAAVSWRIRLSSVHAAQAVVRAASSNTMLRARRDGNDALIVASDPSLADWMGATDCR